MEEEREKLLERIAPLLVGKELDICLNTNRQTIIRVIKFVKNKALISLHTIFLQAPTDVLQALVTYIFSSGHEQRKAKGVLRGFIEVEFHRLDLTSSLNAEKLVVQGVVYNLQEIYDEINAQYFAGELQLNITWYGKTVAKRKKAITCGEFFQALRLVKVHRQLDQQKIPRFYVAYIVYHEMLHAVVPPYLDENASVRLHGPEFKEREKLFAHFAEVKAWEKEHARIFFK